MQFPSCIDIDQDPRSCNPDRPADLAVFFHSCPVTIAISHLAYPRTYGHAELALVTGLNTKMVYSRAVTHPSTNRARRRAKSGKHCRIVRLHVLSESLERKYVTEKKLRHPPTCS